MKKVVLCAAMAAVFCIDEGVAMDSALTRVGENRIATVGENVGTMMVRSVENTDVVDIKEEIRYDDFFEFDGNKAVVSFSKGMVDGDQFIIQDTFEKEYPYEKIFKRLEKADENHSYAIYEIFANTSEVGRLQLTDSFVDEDNLLEHQKKESNIIDNDDELVTIKDVETYVMLGEEKQIVGTEEGVRFPYTLSRTEKDERYTDAPNGGDNVNIYVRWNGEEVRRAWDGLALVEKPVRESPVAAQTPRRQEEVHYQGPSNEFARGIQAVSRGDCVIM
jgi:hypothetical protein